MRAWPLALALGGCGFSSSALPLDADIDSRPIDAAVDATPDMMATQLCLGTMHRICVAAPTSSLSLMTQPISTSSSTLCTPYTATPAVDACVIAGQTISLPSGNIVTVTGTKRLILIAADSLTITGTLDASSRRGLPGGPAADTGPCAVGAIAPTTNMQGGGGWGGTFGSGGGNGGTTPSGGIGGSAGAPQSITALAGGCPGGNGAPNGVNVGAGGGGHGGGAVMLLAGQTLQIDGVVNASGGGGSGGKSAGGGGGGGAGGMIVLESPSVKVPGQCFANGGGAGEGGAASNRDGAVGRESTGPDKVGTGGRAGSIGGDGGDGAFAATGATSGGNGGARAQPPDTGGGGGGAGGAGIIKVVAGSQEHTSETNHVAPPPT
jgi:hypothetical protein